MEKINLYEKEKLNNSKFSLKKESIKNHILSSLIFLGITTSNAGIKNEEVNNIELGVAQNQINCKNGDTPLIHFRQVHGGGYEYNMKMNNINTVSNIIDVQNNLYNIILGYSNLDGFKLVTEGLEDNGSNSFFNTIFSGNNFGGKRG